MTGSTGFIGTWMRKVLADSGVRCDLRHFNYRDDRWKNKDELNWLNTTLKPVDYTVHLAPVDASIPLWAEAGIKTLFTSSGAVHDIEPGEYSKLKVKTEKELSDSGIPLAIARIYTTYGPYMKPHFAISTFIRNAINKEPIRLFNNGGSWRSYMYGEDCAIWLWKILIDGNGIYDVGSRVGMSITQVAKAVADRFTPRPKIMIDSKPFIDPRTMYIPDTTRAVVELGLTHKMRFDNGIDETIRWMKEDIYDKAQHEGGNG